MQHHQVNGQAQQQLNSYSQLKCHTSKRARRQLVEVTAAAAAAAHSTAQHTM
jgi:hypothetical protein